MILQEFIDYSLNSKTTLKEFEIKISPEACEIIKKHTNLNISKYKFIIKEESIRHIRNRHNEDLVLLHKIPEVLNNFNSIEKSITKDTETRQNNVSLVFRKKFNDGIVRMVALRIIKGNILSLKTFFRQ